jgi:pimeloyl-ACP methyl ester carboxylesterase
MFPLFFGSSPNLLFGAHSSPSKAARDTGVVIVPPMGQEAIRAHRAIRQLGLRLSRERFHALRFDLRGTGDSAGDFADARLDAWVEDTRAAMDELRDRTGIQRVSLVGLRLGAALACRAAHGRRDVDKIILWEPVFSGARYLGELAKRHEDFLRAELPRRRTAPFAREGEVLGFPLSKELADDLRAIDLPREPKLDARAATVVTIAGADDEALERALPSMAPRTELVRLTLAQDWNSDEAVNTSLVPSEALDVIVKAVGER